MIPVTYFVKLFIFVAFNVTKMVTDSRLIRIQSHDLPTCDHHVNDRKPFFECSQFFFRFLLIVYSHVQFFFFTRQYVFRLETRTYVLEIIIKNMNRKYLLGTSDEEGRDATPPAVAAICPMRDGC